MPQTEAIRRTFAGSDIRRSVMVALVIGTLLNAINQGPGIVTGHRPVW